MGIQSMTARRAAAEADPDFTRNRATSSSLQGLSRVRRTPENYRAGRNQYRGMGHYRSSSVGARPRARTASGGSRIEFLAPKPRKKYSSNAARNYAAPNPRGPKSGRNRYYSVGATGISTRRRKAPRQFYNGNDGIKPMSAQDAKELAKNGMQLYGLNSGIRWQSPDAHKRVRSNSTDSKGWFARSNPMNALEGKTKTDLREAFDAVDLDQSNSIELDEFTSALKYMGAEMDVHQMETLFREIDTDRSGAIDFEEFVTGYEKIDVMRSFVEKSLKDAGLSLRKAGPREVGRQRVKLASERAGIKPMTATQAAAEADPFFFRQKVTKSSLKGFSTTSTPQRRKRLANGD